MNSLIQIPTCKECNNKESLFCDLSSQIKENISINKGSNFYKKGQVIFYEGNQSRGLYCIHKGKVKLSKLGLNSKEQVVRFAKTEDILGYHSLFNQGPYQTTATVLEDSYVCHISKEKFMEAIQTSPKLAQKIMTLLANDLNNAEQYLINLSQKKAKGRIVDALVLIYSSFGFLTDNKTLSISLSRSEIADIAGTTAETVIRILAQLNKDKVIRLNEKKIIIPNIEKLKKNQ